MTRKIGEVISMNKVQKSASEVITKKAWLPAISILVMVTITTHLLMGIPTVKSYVYILGVPPAVKSLLKAMIPLLIYIYYDKKSFSCLDRLIVLYLVRCLLIYTVTRVYPLSVNNFPWFILISYSIYLGTTFFPYNLSFMNDKRMESIKKSLLLAKKKIVILIFYEFCLALFSTLLLGGRNKDLTYYIAVAIIFFNYEVKKYNIWKKGI